MRLLGPAFVLFSIVHVGQALAVTLPGPLTRPPLSSGGGLLGDGIPDEWTIPGPPPGFGVFDRLPPAPPVDDDEDAAVLDPVVPPVDDGPGDVIIVPPPVPASVPLPAPFALLVSALLSVPVLRLARAGSGRRR